MLAAANKMLAAAYIPPRNTFPLCGKNTETRFHSMEKHPKHVSIQWKRVSAPQRLRQLRDSASAPDQLHVTIHRRWRHCSRERLAISQLPTRF